MTRPRVSPDKRQRTAQACDSCKRRKQKCNGLQPCNTCTRRNLVCAFGVTNSEHGSDEQSPAKRQMVDHIKSPQSDMQSPRDSLQQLPPMKTGSGTSTTTLSALQGAQSFAKGSPSDQSAQPIGHFSTSPSRPKFFQPASPAFIANEKLAAPAVGETESLVKDGSGQDEVARVFPDSRMLEDPTGRLLYVGDSASLSYLQLIRGYITTIAGDSEFTMDPRRFRIVENPFTLPANIRITHLLPDKMTAHVLVDSFFTNTSGFIHFVNQGKFLATLENCYSDPLHVKPESLCLLNLIFAIGLVLASPIPGSRDDDIVKKLRDDKLDRAEVFYKSAKSLCDPISGFEDADFWSVQALLLMTLYMLTLSKRNAAYAYCGMAIRSGFALGLHRNSTLQIFPDQERLDRRNTWWSLFIVDAFLAASLGRPTSISNEDCSTEPLKWDFPLYSAGPSHGADTSSTNSLGVEASVRSCKVVGTILKTIYSKRKCDAKIAHEIVEQCKPWPELLDSSLHWRQMSGLNYLNARHGTAILHVNLLYCHTVILLTRPFFIDLMVKVWKGQRFQRVGSRTEKLSDACLSAACQSILLVQTAKDGNYLARRNPFVLYYHFAAALIVLSNQFFALHDTSGRADSCIDSSINIMKFCAETDSLADRLLFILDSFRNVVDRQKNVQGNFSQGSKQRAASFRFVASKHQDPILSFFSHMSSSGSSNSSNGNIVGVSSSTFGNPNGNTMPSSGSMSIASLIMQPPTAHSNASPTNSTTRHGSTDGADSLEGEIDFENLWNMQGMAAAPAGPLLFNGGAMGGGGGGGLRSGHGQGIGESAVPLFEVNRFPG